MKNYKYHILYWGINYVTYCFSHFESFSTKIYWYPFLIILINLCGYMITFYMTLRFIIPTLWERGKYFFSIFSIMGLVAIVFFFKVELFAFFPISEGDNSVNISKAKILCFEIMMTSTHLFFAFILLYLEKIKDTSEIQLQIIQENTHLEQTIINTELRNLKNQINPDFLFQKLDFFYRESLAYSPSLSQGITLLTDMMHYAIDDEDDNGRVPLVKEVKHIQNFIEINQLRFDGRLQVDFQVNGIEEKHLIMPLILITFVENAFKYGELNDVANPLKIIIDVNNCELSFRTYNLTRKGPMELSEGIGIANTQKRLYLAYPERHKLVIKHTAEYHEVILNMIL
jgi:two-component system LytT family sensor kinase